MDTETLLRKAAMVVSDLSSGGLLNPAQANRFIDMMLEQTVLSADARIERMNSPKQLFEKIGFSSRIMVPAQEATDPGDTANPTTAKVELSTVEGIAIAPVSYSTLEDNIERGSLADHIVRLIAERAGLDLEEQWLNGDESAASGDAWLDQNDGLAGLVSSHTEAADATDTVVAALDLAFRNLPGKYVRNKREWRHYVHPDVEFRLRQELSERSTSAGDRYLLDDAPVLVRGVPVVAIPMLATRQEDVGTVDAAETVSDAYLIHPKNVVIGIQRAISIESERKIRERVIDYVATVRSDIEFEEEDAVSRVTSIPHAGPAA